MSSEHVAYNCVSVSISSYYAVPAEYFDFNRCSKLYWMTYFKVDPKESWRFWHM